LASVTILLQSRVWSLTSWSTGGRRRVNGCSRSIGAGPEMISGVRASSTRMESI